MEINPDYECRIFGGSDYCPDCGRDLCRPRPQLCIVRIPDSAIAAYGCYRENYMKEKKMEGDAPCNKWCRAVECTFSLKEPTESEDGSADV